MIGLYLIGFGLFEVVLELKHVPSVIKYCPALETFFGKGFFWVFWGFLLFGRQIGLRILAVVYLAAGICFMAAHFVVREPPVHLMGDDQLADAKAAQSLERYETDDHGAPAGPPDPYLSGFEDPEQHL
mmetsp:Transcript_5648/g.14546  ORF Transcript_5648/g.14546 Transcript_5648/m.14546 type:complete len:128 (-) Transcript_5648:234-617(-)